MITRSRRSVLRPSPLDNDAALICWVPFDGGAGTDFSGNQNNAVAVSTPVFTPSEMGDGYAMSTGKYFQVTTLGASNPIATNAVTAACWLTPNATTRGDIISVWGGNGGLNDQFVLLYGLTSGKPEMYCVVTATVRTAGLGTTAMVAGQRYHVAGTYDGSIIRVYLNGKQESAASFSGTLPAGSANPIQIGTSAGSTNTANGTVADARVYNRALSGGEINALYNQGIARLSLSPDEWEMPTLRASAASTTSRQYIASPGVYVSETGTRSEILALGAYVTETVSAVTATQYAAFSLPQHSLSQVIQKMVGY